MFSICCAQDPVGLEHPLPLRPTFFMFNSAQHVIELSCCAQIVQWASNHQCPIWPLRYEKNSTHLSYLLSIICEQILSLRENLILEWLCLPRQQKVSHKVVSFCKNSPKNGSMSIHLRLHLKHSFHMCFPLSVP